MYIKDITPQAKVRHGYRVYIDKQIGNKIYHCRFDLIVTKYEISIDPLPVNIETITTIVKPASKPVSNGKDWYLSPDYVADPYKYDPYWWHWNFQFEQWREMQKQERF